MADRLVVRGAREHNLKDVSLDLPRDSLIVFTGLCGSGKSSLAFDTIFAEGQRRYVESLSAYARQFLGQMDKPDVDFIDGLSPAVSIDQKAASLPGEAWAAQVQMLAGPPMPARRVPDWRLREVEIHHVDLAAGYRPADWPEEFVTDNLPEVAGSFAGREDTPSCLLEPDGGGFGRLRIGPAGLEQPATPGVFVSGPPVTLLAWLIGRDDGSGLRVSGDDAVLPVLPPWR